MASIENRSNYEVTVRNRDDLTQTFAHSALKRAKAYQQSLASQGFKSKLSRRDDYYVVRDRSRLRKEQVLRAGSLAEAKAIQSLLENEQRQGLIVDYAQGFQTSLAELMIRYLREEAPRQKSFEVVAYKINAMLEDAGLPRQDIAQIVADHSNPHPKVKAMKIRQSTGTRTGEPSDASKFIRKGFAAITPDDFTDYIDERCQAVAPATVDREIDIFSAVCRMAIDTWRIHVVKSPMDGVRRPKYYNERDRRLTADEEARLLEAARGEDRDDSIKRRLEQLMSDEREEANEAATVYQRKKIVKGARQHYMAEAERSYQHIPLLETFIHFQLMTGARRSETLTLSWSNVDLQAQTAYLPETKNGRARKLALRRDLVTMLAQLPRDSEQVFPIGVDGLRKDWARICQQAGLQGEDNLRIHDLRHEAISRVAEASSNTPGGFTLIDLQHFSGHRDVRMLMRYAHLCTQALAKRLDAAFASDKESHAHRGRRRLNSNASLSLHDILDAQTAPAQLDTFPDAESASKVIAQAKNVIAVDFRARAG